MPPKPRFVFYAVNGLGLGHVTRLLAIARQVRKLAPRAEILFLTSSEADDVIAREGFAAFKVPSRTLRARAGLSAGTHARLVQTVSLNLIAAFAPHVLVVDTFPAGTLQELLPILRWDLRKVFVFRAQKPDAANAAAMQNTLRLYDLVIVPHNEGEETIPLPEGTNAVWTGSILIRGKDEAFSREDARAKLGISADALALYLTFGGGGDQEAAELMERILEIIAIRPEWTPVVSDPPLDYANKLRSSNIQMVRHYPMAELYNAFDAAIASAGYNTVGELLHFGIPSLFIAFERKLDDQFARAQRIADANAGFSLAKFDAAEICTILDTLAKTQTRIQLSANAQNIVSNNGAERAARALLEILA